jgi:ATP-dependent RNA helicase DHX37/DHR1
LLQALATCQIPINELNQLTKLTSIQTKGLKKHFHDQKSGSKLNTVEETNANQFIKSGVRGIKRNISESDSEVEDERASVKRDFNVVALDQSATSDENDLSNDDETIILQDSMSLAPAIIENKKESIKKAIDRKAAIYVNVDRKPEVQSKRLLLPIIAEEQIIMEAISENPVVIIVGATGSGKTTQVPQFLYEAGYARNGKIIGITEPRRIAAISMSQRVAYELNLCANEISYLIRFEGNCTADTKIKFMTDGVLLKEIEHDFLLQKYSVIILDEAHERSAYTDILIGLLSRIVQVRERKGDKLKVIIMSATLRVETFTENSKLFQTSPPVINVETRQFPVTDHFSKTTPDDYVREALMKVIKIHTRLPEGGILLFLTGQQEVNYVVRKLKKLFPYSKTAIKSKEPLSSDCDKDDCVDDDEDANDDINLICKGRKKNKRHKKKKMKINTRTTLTKVNLEDFQMPGEETEMDLSSDFLSDGDCDDDVADETNEMLNNILQSSSSQALWVLPLYSLLPSQEQKKVFQSAPEGTRPCIVATNVAETSITIPAIKYVVDSGRMKTKLYDKCTGVNKFTITFISKASADQRKGRAGRIGPGHCYRLYSSAVYNNEFVPFSCPEIQEKPIDGLMLQMKAIGIDKVVNFPFPSPPDKLQLEMAEKRLKTLGALNGDKLSTITKLGRTIAAFPVSPRFGKILALSSQQNLIEYVICLVAALSVQEVLIEKPTKNDDFVQSDTISKLKLKRKQWARTGNFLLLGDAMVLLNAIGSAEYSQTQGKLDEFCTENGLRLKAVVEIRKIRKQLTTEISLNFPNLSLTINPKLEPPSDAQAKLLRQILLAGLGDHVARKVPNDEINLLKDKVKMKHAYQIPEMEEPVFVHSCSVLKKAQPDWIIYQEIFETQHNGNIKMFIRGITAIEPEWLLIYCPTLCNIMKILEDPEPLYNSNEDKIMCYVQASFGKSGWLLPITKIEMTSSLEKYRYFAKFILEGDVLSELKNFKSVLLSSSSTVTKSWSKLVPKTEMIVNALANRGIDSRQKLLKELKSNSTCKFLKVQSYFLSNHSLFF